MVQQVGTNTFGVAKWIVDPTLSNGTHTTIAGALASASSGETIAIRPGTYTENLTLKAGVTLLGMAQGTVTIVGKCSATFSGVSYIQNIAMTTSGDFALEVSGAAATTVQLYNCVVSGNNTLISHSSSDAGSLISIKNCSLDIRTTGISIFSSTSAGGISFRGCLANNTGLSTTASTITSAQVLLYYTEFYNAITTSGTASIDFRYSFLSTAAAPATCLTHGGSGTSSIVSSDIFSSTATALTITGTLTCSNISVSSSNATAIGGAGTIIYDEINFYGTSSVCSVTTQTARENLISDAKFGDGTAAIPSIAFQNTTNMGFYRSGAGAIGVSFSGAQFGTWSSASLSGATTGQYALAYSAAADSTPTYSFTGDSDTGMYRSAANTLKLVTNSAAAVVIDSAGEVTMPLQPAFLATANDQVDVTGDGTVYTVVFANEIFDQNADFDGTSTFTAPITGRYQINVTMEIGGILVTNTEGYAMIVTSNRSIAFMGANFGVVQTSSNHYRGCGSALVDMDAGDTATVAVMVAGGTKVVDVTGTNSTFSAFLAC